MGGGTKKTFFTQRERDELSGRAFGGDRGGLPQRFYWVELAGQLNKTPKEVREGYTYEDIISMGQLQNVKNQALKFEKFAEEQEAKFGMRT